MHQRVSQRMHLFQCEARSDDRTHAGFNRPRCNGCVLCFEACPEPFGLLPMPGKDFDPEVVDPETLFRPRPSTATIPRGTPDKRIPLPVREPMVLKGTHASAVGAILAGCRHFFGYPITPSTEGENEKARQYYEKSLELNPRNRTAADMLENLKE